MDIMLPPLEGQVDPQPWLVAQQAVDVPALVRRILKRDPDATPDEVLRILSGWKVRANGALVAEQVQEFRKASGGN